MSPAAQKRTLAPDPESKTSAVAVLAVASGNELYGFPLSAIREILTPPPLTEVPRSPASVLGVITVRGQIITTLDLRVLLNLQVTNAQLPGRVLLVDGGDELIGVAVDRVLQVHRLEPHQIEYASVMSTELSNYILGVGRPGAPSTGPQDILILIDPVSLLEGLR